VTGVDERAIGVLKFEKDILAQISCGITVNQENFVRIFGSDGMITLSKPYPHYRSGGDVTTILAQNYKLKKTDEIKIETDITPFSMEADAFAAALSQGRREAIPPAPTRADTLGSMKTLDRWREDIGLTYEQEKPTAYRKTTARGTVLAKPASGEMKYGKIAHLEKPVSRLIMGVDNQRSFPHCAVLFDDYFERGGNTFDTAFVYGGGRQEVLLGEWIKHRGVRDQINIIVKGVHTPYCNPIDLTTQLHESLKRLQIDHADIYMMHRDNPDYPVSAFIDELNKHVKAGKIKAFGGSNWSDARVAEANEYAKKAGLQGFSVVSNNLSLAQMMKPIWDGCVCANKPESLAFFKQQQLALLSWSSQARGFFVPGLAHPDKKDNREMVEVWYSDQNFERLKRANELAAKLNVAPINLALAWVLTQEFPTFALIGPRTLEETRTSWPALGVELTPQQVKWLNLE
jgi:aryl-alcohol dehydrogenase-like predicted oxidoreductase